MRDPAGSSPFPNALLRLVPFLQKFYLGLNVRSVLFVLPAGRVQGLLLRLDGLLASLSLLALGSLLLRAFALAALLLFLESERRLAVGRLVVSLLRMPLVLAARRLAVRLLRSVAAGEIGRQLGMLFEGPLEPTGRFRTTPGAAIVAATMWGSSLCLAAP